MNLVSPVGCYDRNPQEPVCQGWFQPNIIWAGLYHLLYLRSFLGLVQKRPQGAVPRSCRCSNPPGIRSSNPLTSLRKVTAQMSSCFSGHLRGTLFLSLRVSRAQNQEGRESKHCLVETLGFWFPTFTTIDFNRFGAGPFSGKQKVWTCWPVPKRSRGQGWSTAYRVLVAGLVVAVTACAAFWPAQAMGVSQNWVGFCEGLFFVV